MQVQPQNLQSSSKKNKTYSQKIGMNLYDETRFCEWGTKLYCEINEKQYEQFQNSIRQTGISKFEEWVKILLKAQNPTNGDKSNADLTSPGISWEQHKNPIFETYRCILDCKPRLWYEEITQLYKQERSQQSKLSNGIQTFDRKLIQIQEHFRWQVNAIANMVFNSQSPKNQGSSYFPSHQSSKSSKNLKNRQNSQNGGSSFKQISSQTSEINLEEYESTTYQQYLMSRQTSAQNSKQGQLQSQQQYSNFQTTVNSMLSNNNYNSNISKNGNQSIQTFNSIEDFFVKDLPLPHSNIWLGGFVYKGVYYRLLPKQKAKQLMAEFKVLKHLSIEYFQNDAKYQMKDIFYMPQEQDRSVQREQMKNVNILLPLISCVEGPSFTLYGTPIVYSGKSQNLVLKNYEMKPGNQIFPKDLFLLSQLKKSHLKQYQKKDSLKDDKNIYLIISNVFNIFYKNLQNYQAISSFVISSEPNSNIVYFEQNYENFIEIKDLKSMLNVKNIDIDEREILNKSSQEIYAQKFDQKKIFSQISQLQKQFQPNIKARQFLSECIRSKIDGTTNKKALDQLYQQINEVENIYGNVLIIQIKNYQNGFLSPVCISGTSSQNLFFKQNTKYEYTQQEIQQLQNLSIEQRYEQTVNLIQQQEYLRQVQFKGIQNIQQILDFDDTVLNSMDLKTILHRNSVNSYLEFIIYTKLQSQKAKALVGCDILARIVKKIMSEYTSKHLKYLDNLQYNNQKPLIEEFKTFYSENYFKTILVKIMNYLLKLKPMDQNLDKGYTGLANQINQGLIIEKLKSHSLAPFFLQRREELPYYLSSNFLQDILMHAIKDSNIFLTSISYHLQITFNYNDFERRLKTDKYYFLLANMPIGFKPQDIISHNYISHTYLNLKEKASLLLVKEFSQNMREIYNQNDDEQVNSFNSIANDTYLLQLQPSLYKLKFDYKITSSPYQSMNNSNNISQNSNNKLYNSMDQPLEQIKKNILSDKYQFPDGAMLNDFAIYIESVFAQLKTVQAEENYLIEIYVLQIFIAYFIEKDEEQCKIIVEKIISCMNSTPLCSPELVIIVHTILGLLSENKSLLESEQNYMMALLSIHKYYGDPRGRGAIGTPWELFLTWRLSIITRLQGKTHDSEYVEELFDATILSMKENRLNKFKFQHEFFDNPFYQFSGFSNQYKQQQEENKINTRILNNNNKNMITKKEYQNPKTKSSKDNMNNQNIQPHKKQNKEQQQQPPNQTNNKHISNIEQDPSVANNKDKNPYQTVDKRHPFTHWTLHLSYTENSSKIEVLSSTLEKINQELFQWMVKHFTTIGSQQRVLWRLSQLQNFQFSIMQNSFTQYNSVPSSISNYSLRERPQINSKESSEQQKNNHNNNQGTWANDKQSVKYEKTGTGVISKPFNQSGSVVQIFERDISTYNKKDMTGVAYSWGFNNNGQLGNILEDKKHHNNNLKVLYPKLILPLKDTIIVSITCGYTFTLAITLHRNVVAWGDNSYHQLGLGEEPVQEKVLIPTQIPNLNNISAVACGNEHSIALDLKGKVFSWGNGESGLLGHGDSQSYSSPKQIMALDKNQVESVACGSLHTIVQANGQCFAWGKGEGGQLGLPENTLINKDGELYIDTPQKIQIGLEGQVIKQVACGDAHTLVLTTQGKVYGWGYTNYGQLGLGYEHDTIENFPGKQLIIKQPVLIEKIQHVNIIQIYAGSTFSMFKNEKNELYSCGLNDQNQLGQEKQQPIAFTLNINNQNGIQNKKKKPKDNQYMDFTVPKKIDCFKNMPILHLQCGCTHSIALTCRDKNYMLFSWGMNKHSQLGLGENGVINTTPRPITYLYDLTTYSIGCGNYHTAVIIGNNGLLMNKNQQQQFQIQLQESDNQFFNKWNFSFYDINDDYDSVQEYAQSNLEQITPSDEGKIDDPKWIQKPIVSQQEN